MKNKLIIVFAIILSVVLLSTKTLSAPIGPSGLTNLGSSSYGTNSAANISAIAGNVSELNFDVNVSTDTWQGYFGNVTGNIVLGNSNNRSLYDWTLTVPRGQIYATRVAATPTWTSIRCANLTEINSEDSTLGVNQSIDADSVNRTFSNLTSFNSFYVGGVYINASTSACHAVHLNDEAGDPSANFAEVLLASGSNMIYTGIISSPTTGFDGNSHQFQMLVGENGHQDDAAVTPYYFYLELR